MSGATMQTAHTAYDPGSLMQTYAKPTVVFVRGSGTELFDEEGKRYLDFLCGIAVTSLGHAHPEVARAISDQANTLLHTSNLFATLGGAQVALTLDRLIGDGTPAFGSVFFCNSGTEANECAIKLARKWAAAKSRSNDRYGIVSALGSFHGRTLGSLCATGQLAKHVGFGPLAPGFFHVAYDDLDALDAACDPDTIAAVILETIQGEAGVVEPSPGYIEGARELCSARGILLILDEVQTGLGRTGRWFGFHSSGVMPDIVTVAKALGNGMPIGACWASAEVASAFGPGDHGSTFGGQPLAASAAAATLAVMERIDAPTMASKAGDLLKSGLLQIPGVDSVRGKGLLLGVQLTSESSGGTALAGRAGEIASSALERGLVLNAPRPDTLRIAPPYQVTESQIEEALQILADVIGGAT
jgi:acetylornithine/N-succinyldiaminopimelate aminotransferase